MASLGASKLGRAAPSSPPARCSPTTGATLDCQKLEAEQRADELLEVFDLAAKASTKPHRLSGGMRRRLLIARALVHQPRLLILDEPTAGVDLELRHELWRYLRRLHGEQGLTVLLTTH